MFSAACEAVGSTRGEKTAWIAYFLSRKNVKKCRHAPQEATDEAQRQKDIIAAAKKDGDTESTTETRNMKWSRTASNTTDSHPKQKKLKVYRGVDMPFSVEQKVAIQAQAERAIISTNSSFSLFEDPEMQTLIGMLRAEAPKIMPKRKVASGRLLNEAAAKVEEKIAKTLKGKEIGMT